MECESEIVYSNIYWCMTLPLSLLSILQAYDFCLNNVGTYDWMKDKTADYKAVKENAKDS